MHHSEHEAFQQAAFLIIGAFIAGIVSFFLTWLKRRRDGRDQFLAVTADMRSKLDSTEQVEAFVFESIPILRLAIYRVRPFISLKKWECLLAKWQDYQGPKHPNPDFQEFRNIVKEKAGKEPITTKTVIEILDDFDRLVN